MTTKFKAGDYIVCLRRRVDVTPDKAYVLLPYSSDRYVQFIDDAGDLNTVCIEDVRHAEPDELAALHAPRSPSRTLDLTTLKAGDIVTIRAEVVRAKPDCDGEITVEAGCAGLHFHIHANAIIAIERAALAIGDRVREGCLVGPIVFQEGNDSVFKDEDVGLVVRKTADLVLAQ